MENRRKFGFLHRRQMCPFLNVGKWKKRAGIGNLIDESGNAVCEKFTGLLF